MFLMGQPRPLGLYMEHSKSTTSENLKNDPLKYGAGIQTLNHGDVP